MSQTSEAAAKAVAAGKRASPAVAAAHRWSARREAAAAIAICRACPVWAQCLELSLRHWDAGQYGVWGGLVPAERAALRRRWPLRERERSFA
jgi:hypothetical protein